MSKRAILYARVSTDEQADKGYSLPSQFDAMRKYAAEQGFSIVGEFQDDFTGTVPIEQRPEGRRAYQMLKSGHADALIGYTIDRLVRPPEEGDEWEMPLLIRGLAKLGKELHAVNRGKLETSFAGLLLAMLDAKSAGDERRKIIERTTRGHYTKARAGKVSGAGMSPYGYQFVTDDNNTPIGLAVVDAEGHIVKLIYTWYVYGDAGNDHRPMSLWAITRRLTEMKIPTPEKRRAYRKKEQHVWNEVTVKRILQSETYAGVWRYGKKIGTNGRGGKRPIEQQVAVSVPPIVDRQLWHAAQAQREYNKRMSMRNCKHQYLLRGLGKCGACGSALTGHWPIPTSFYYHCSQKSHRFPGLEQLCSQTNTNVRGDVLEHAVWEYILNLWSDAAEFERILRKAQQAELDALQPKRERLEAVLELIANGEREATKTARAMQRIGDDPEDPVWQRLDHDRLSIKQRYQELTKEREELRLALDSRQYTDERIAAALKTREEVVVGLRVPTFEAKRQALEFLRVQVTVQDGKAWVMCVAATEPTLIDLHTTCRRSCPCRSRAAGRAARCD